MYIPTAFAEKDQAKLHAFMEAYSFGLLVSTQQGQPFASHLPFLLDRTRGPCGTLIGHMARANPQWRGLDGQEVLAIFSGPHAYISPTWYESDTVVPTWNYVAVHAYGPFHSIEEPQELTELLTAAVRTYEQSRPEPWQLDSNADFFQKLLRAIVGFRIEISRLEGKWKLNQNHPHERRQRVIRVLQAAAHPDAQEIARLMAAAGEKTAGPAT